MAFKIKDGLNISSIDVFNNQGELLINAPTASKLLTPRNITLTGDASGFASFDGSQNVSIDVSIAGFDSDGPTPVFTGTVTGDLIGDVFAQDGVSKILENGTDGTNAVFTGNVTGNATTATAWQTARTLTLAGDLGGNVSIDGSQNVTLTATIQPNSVALGTDTTGNYVESISAVPNTGISVSGTGESAIVSVAGIDATTSVKGVASFNSTNFAVTSGDVTIKAGGVTNNNLVNSSITVGTTAVELGSSTTTIAGLAQVDIANIRINNNTIVSTNTNGTIAISPNGSGDVSVENSKITNVLAPILPSDAANKAYVDDVAQGLRTLPSAKAISLSNLVADYDNGVDGVGSTLTAQTEEEFPLVDGVQLEVGDRLIVNGQTNKAHNGAYVLTTKGDVSTKWILTRADEANEADEQAGTFEFVTSGDIYINSGWVLTTLSTPVIIGTTELEWVQFSAAGLFTAGPGLSLTGNEFSVNVDDTTIEIFNDVLRIKAGSIGAGELADGGFDIAADSGVTNTVNLGETFTISGGTGITTAVSNNQITVIGSDATTNTKGIASFNSAFFTVSSGAVSIANNAIVLGTNTSGNYVESVTAGTGIAVTGTIGEGWNPEVSLSFLGLETLADPNANRIAYWNNLSKTFDWLAAGTGIEITGGNLNNTQQAFKTISVADEDDVEATEINDTLTLVAGDNITIDTNSTTKTITINADASQEIVSAVQVVATTAPTLVDSFSLSESRSAKYYIQISQGTNYQVSELLVIHDGLITFNTEYAVLETAGELGAFSTAINGGNVQLIVTMASANSATVRIKRITLDND